MKIHVIAIVLSIVFSSTTSAQTWQYLGLKNANVVKIVADTITSNIIWAGSQGGSTPSGNPIIGGVFKSTNGGADWDTLIRNYPVSDIKIHPFNPNIVYVSSTVGSIMRTADGGINWEARNNGLLLQAYKGVYALAIHPQVPNIMYAGTGGMSGGEFYRSMNGGSSWDTIGVSPYLRQGVFTITIDPSNPNILYAGSGNMLKSTDGGITFEESGLFLQGTINDVLIHPQTPQKIYAALTDAYEPNGIQVSTNSGISWLSQTFGIDGGFIQGLQVRLDTGNNDMLYVIARYGSPPPQGNGSIKEGLFKKPDNSTSWSEIPLPSGLSAGSQVLVRALEVQKTVSGLRVYVGIHAGEGQGIYCLSTTLSSPEPPRTALGYVLYQNYPNPFNPETIINYELGKTQNVSLKVFDVLGREVAKLVNYRQSAGNYRVRFNATGLSGGVYFYRLQAGGFGETRKMLLLK